jgi:hypothetical protein
MRALIGWTAGALAVWTACAQWLAPPVPAIPLAPLQNAIVAERLAERGASLLVLGSSLTARLPMHEVDPDAMAVGISGGSAPDAIALARALGRRPRVAIIEMNRLDLTADQPAMSTVADAARRRFPWRILRTEYRPSTQAIALVVRASDLFRERLMSEDARRMVEARAVRASANDDVDTVATAESLDWARTALEEWRRAGTAVLLVELPVHRALYADENRRRVIDAVFPDSLYPRVSLGQGPWPTTDGRHLERAAARSAARIIVEAARRAAPPMVTTNTRP